jgi:tetratricopeptide (TPR) repeat protein
MEDRPDSAMRLVDSIFYPEKSLRKPQYMQYLVTRVRARYKNYRPVAEDTLVFKATDYFVSKGKDPRRITLAYFYSGCVHRERKEYDKAMQHYKEAEHHAAQTGDADLQGLVQYNMGDLLAEEGLHAQALEKYKAAETWYRQSSVNPDEKQARCLAATGRMCLLLGEQDSAFAAFHKGLELAETSGNSELQSLLTQNLSVAYREAEQYNEAVKYLRQSFILNNDTSELLRYCLNFAELYLQTNRPDSLVFLQGQVNPKSGCRSRPIPQSKRL